jgi:hypothetical protein
MAAAAMSYRSGGGRWRVRITGHESTAGARGHQGCQELRDGISSGVQGRGPGGTAFYALAGAGGAAVPSLAELGAQVTGLLASLCGDGAGAA